jgi:predicted transcriptional regulator
MADETADPVTEYFNQPAQPEVVTKYLGALALLAECAVYVPVDVRENIEAALDDAKESVPRLTWRRVADAIVVDIEAEWEPSAEELAEIDAGLAEVHRGEMIASEDVLAEMDREMERILAGEHSTRSVLPNVLGCPRIGHDQRTPCGCIREPEPGDVYVFTERAENPNDSKFPTGSPVVIVERTTATPSDMISARGYNWVCEANNGRTVWSSIEFLLHVGALRLVGTDCRLLIEDGAAYDKPKVEKPQ